MSDFHNEIELEGEADPPAYQRAQVRLCCLVHGLFSFFFFFFFFFFSFFSLPHFSFPPLYCSPPTSSQERRQREERAAILALENGPAAGSQNDDGTLNSLLEETTQLADRFASLDADDSRAVAVRPAADVASAGGAASAASAASPAADGPQDATVPITEKHFETWTPPEENDSLSDVEDDAVADVRAQSTA